MPTSCFTLILSVLYRYRYIYIYIYTLRVGCREWGRWEGAGREGGGGWAEAKGKRDPVTNPTSHQKRQRGCL